jgi:hypothetical protein
VLWRAHATALDLDGRVDGGRLLEALRRAGVSELDVVVLRSSSAALDATVDALRRRATIGRLVTPSSTDGSTSLLVGDLRVDTHPSGGRLTVEIAVEPAGSARGPPV